MSRTERILVRISVLQTVIAVLGTLTGAVALYAALNQSDAVRKQLSASVWPMVRVATFEFDVVHGRRVSKMEARNVGVGTARFTALPLARNGHAPFELIAIGEADGESDVPLRFSATGS